jgi:hypothetical protein
MPRDSRQDNRLTATMSQRLAVLIPDYVELAGSDPKISKKIQRLKNFVRLGFISQEDAEPLLLLLNGDRMATWITSPETKDITKIGIQMPRTTREIKVDG